MQPPSDTPSEALPMHVYKIDKLIDEYRANNDLEVQEDLNAVIDVEDNNPGSIQKVAGESLKLF